MVDNFKPISELLEFPNEKTFYFLQILQRKKDHKGEALGGSNNNSRLIKAYYITSKEKLFIHAEEIIKLCDLFNARASINLNPRNLEKTAFQVLSKIAHQMENKDFYGVRKAYDSVCGNYHSEIDKRWLIDIDTTEVETVMGIRHLINSLHAQIENRDYKILATLPSKSGYHIISHPFNLEKFRAIRPEIEVHKNNPTNLYIP